MFHNPVEKDLSKFRLFFAFSANSFLSEIFKRTLHQNVLPVFSIAFLKPSPKLYCQSFEKFDSISEKML